jgi:hypothetical protein
MVRPWEFLPGLFFWKRADEDMESSFALTIFIGGKWVKWGFQRAKAKTISKKSGFAYDFHQEGDFRGKWGK